MTRTADSLDIKRQRLLETIQSYGPVAVAFSGGVDSALVAKAAAIVWQDQAVAVTAASPSLAEGELELAANVAAQIGIRHSVISTYEFLNDSYRANAGDRCFYCKSELYIQLEKLLPELNVSVICNGANLDDQGDHRPGMRAAQQRQIRSPLIDAQLNKSDVRELAKDWELPVWDKPASPCLSSRIAYGVEVTPERVKRVDQAERFLKELLQLTELRVRLEQNDLARIELPVAALALMTQENIRLQVINQLREIGFRYIVLDLEGFRSGSLNAALPLVSLEVSEKANS